jgi:hypothetical protein
MTLPADTIRRILVALDAGVGIPPDIDAIVALAERLHAEILGLVVEDVNLLRSASLPFVHQVSVLTGAQEPFDVEWMEREMRRSALDVESRLGRAASLHHVRWSVRVVRGAFLHETFAAAQEGDLLVVERAPGSRPLDSASNDPAAAAVRRAQRPVLVLRPGSRWLGQPVLAVFDGSKGSVQVVRTAAALASEQGPIVEVALLAPTHEQRQALEYAAHQALEGFTGVVRLHRLMDADPRRACALASRLGSAILFVGAESPILVGSGISQVLAALQCPVWVVR